MSLTAAGPSEKPAIYMLISTAAHSQSADGTSLIPARVERQRRGFCVICALLHALQKVVFAFSYRMIHRRTLLETSIELYIIPQSRGYFFFSPRKLSFSSSSPEDFSSIFRFSTFLNHDHELLFDGGWFQLRPPVSRKCSPPCCLHELQHICVTLLLLNVSLLLQPLPLAFSVQL